MTTATAPTSATSTSRIDNDLNEAIETLRCHGDGLEGLLAYADLPRALRLRVAIALREAGGALALAEELLDGAVHDGMRP
jgi:hypothetical protein